MCTSLSLMPDPLDFESACQGHEMSSKRFALKLPKEISTVTLEGDDVGL